ncbi:MAG: protein-disulfide reductase DsbD family protein [Candidatus Babeliales bacterium]
MKKSLISLSILFFSLTCLHAATVDLKLNKIDEKTYKAEVSFALQDGELLYQHVTDFSVDSPYVALGPVNAHKSPLNKYDPISKETRLIFEHDVTYSMDLANKKEGSNPARFYVTYQTNQQTVPDYKIFELPFSVKAAEETTLTKPEKAAEQKTVHTAKQQSWLNIHAWSSLLSSVIEQSKSLPIRLALVFLLGLLLSLTPCIYPMIPITVGILQTQQKKSVFHNFLNAFAYTIGISTTFACLGLLASFSGPIYGKLLMSPISVGILVIMLGYLGLSMFGLYDIQVPQFLRTQKTMPTGASYISSFLFGAASGTIASPCVSPGLILLLSIVAGLGSVFLGFLLLFAFGVGLSMPLLLIGTFSTSLNILPRAGLWMVEVKKIFGIMLFAVCFYYLHNIMALTTLMYLISIFLMALGTYFLVTSHKTTSYGIKRYHTLMGFVLICASLLCLGYTLQHAYLVVPEEKHATNFWNTNYQEARQKAINEHKLLFLDFWAEYCSLCKAINKKLISQEGIKKALQKTVPVNINGTDEQQEPYKTLHTKFSIKGFPTYLLVDPTNELVLKEWHSELYHMDEETFVQELELYTKR